MEFSFISLHLDSVLSICGWKNVTIQDYSCLKVLLRVEEYDNTRLYTFKSVVIGSKVYSKSVLLKFGQKVYIILSQILAEDREPTKCLRNYGWTSTKTGVVDRVSIKKLQKLGFRNKFRPKIEFQELDFFCLKLRFRSSILGEENPFKRSQFSERG